MMIIQCITYLPTCSIYKSQVYWLYLWKIFTIKLMQWLLHMGLRCSMSPVRLKPDRMYVCMITPVKLAAGREMMISMYNLLTCVFHLQK